MHEWQVIYPPRLILISPLHTFAVTGSILLTFSQNNNVSLYNIKQQSHISFILSYSLIHSKQKPTFHESLFSKQFFPHVLLLNRSQSNYSGRVTIFIALSKAIQLPLFICLVYISTKTIRSNYLGHNNFQVEASIAYCSKKKK